MPTMQYIDLRVGGTGERTPGPDGYGLWISVWTTRSKGAFSFGGAYGRRCHCWGRCQRWRCHAVKQ